MTATAEATPTPAPSESEATTPAPPAPILGVPVFRASILKHVLACAATNDPRRVFLGVRIQREGERRMSATASDGKIGLKVTPIDMGMDEEFPPLAPGFAPFEADSAANVLTAAAVKQVVSFIGDIEKTQRRWRYAMPVAAFVRLETETATGTLWARGFNGNGIPIHGAFCDGRFPNIEGVMPRPLDADETMRAEFGLNAAIAARLFGAIAALSDAKQGCPVVVAVRKATAPIRIYATIFDAWDIEAVLMPLRLAECAVPDPAKQDAQE